MYNWTLLKSKIILKFQKHICLDKIYAYYQNKNKVMFTRYLYG